MMNIKLATDNRKAVAARLAEITSAEARYTRVPRCAYEVGAYIIEKDGTITTSEDADLQPLKILAAEGLVEPFEMITEEPAADRVAFPWFTEVEPDAAMAYTKFIAALCRMSKEAKRVTATQKEVENEKYAFRCFLLRLGFIGTEYKKDRKILLKNLSGSAAFRDGKKGGEEA